MTGDVSLGDNVKAKFGASDDLQIFHDGSNTYINETGTGDLLLSAYSAFKVRSADGLSTGAAFNAYGSVDLYHNNALKLATTSTGIDVTGTVVVDGLTIQGGITEQQVTKSASFTPSFTEGTTYSCTGTMTITMPTATAGKSFTIVHATATSITWAGTIKWNGGSAPTAGAGIDIYVFTSDGTNWYGMQSGTGFA
jgi:hypothetical protein